MPDLLDQGKDLPSFKVVPPRKDFRLEDFTLPDGTPMMGPNGMLVPPARSFQMVLNAATKVLSFRFDEAMRNSPVASRAMRRDAFIRGLLEERILPTINRDWVIEVDDDADPRQQFVRDQLTKLVRAIPDFDAFRRAQLDAVWFGRAACQWAYNRDDENDGLWGIPRWDSIHGDSVQFTFDGVPAILLDSMTTGWYAHNGATQGPGGDLRPTDRGGTALVLQHPYWRDRYAVHRHILEKADYLEGELAGSVQGLGIRGLVYWQYVVRTEALTWMLAYMQAVGQMDLLVFNYPAGNDQAKKQQEANANKIIGKAAIVCPRPPNGNWPSVEQVSMNSAGLKAMHELVADYFDRHIERLIVGQSMSAGADKGTGLGGTGRAEFTRATKDEILVHDTNRLDATLTTDLVRKLKKYNFPWAKFPTRFKSVLPDLKAMEKVESGLKLVSIPGMTIKTDELREAAGFSRPEEGDEVLGQPMPPPMPGGMPGQPGMPPGGPGGPPGAGPAPGGPPMLPAGPPAQNAAYGPVGAPNGTIGYVPGAFDSGLATVAPRERARGHFQAVHNDAGVGAAGVPPTPGPVMAHPGGSNTYLPTWDRTRVALTRHNAPTTPTPYEAGPHKFCSTQVNLTGEAAIKMLWLGNLIRDEHVHSKGREQEPHVTLRYGLHHPDPAPVGRELRGAGPIRMRLGGLAAFKGEDMGKDYDVIVVKVHSPDLRWLNRKLGKLPNTETFKYNPHATVAYVKKGYGELYAKSLPPLNIDVVADGVVFSDQDHQYTWIPTAQPPTGNGPNMNPVGYGRTAYANQHPDVAAISKNISQNPGDMTGRLVLADALQETNDPRHELVRAHAAASGSTGPPRTQRTGGGAQGRSREQRVYDDAQRRISWLDDQERQQIAAHLRANATAGTHYRPDVLSREIGAMLPDFHPLKSAMITAEPDADDVWHPVTPMMANRTHGAWLTRWGSGGVAFQTGPGHATWVDAAVQALHNVRHHGGIRFDLSQIPADEPQPPIQASRYTAYDDDRERQGFLNAIHADPLESTNHLVMADWHDERGEHDEAAFRRAMGEWMGKLGQMGTSPRRTNPDGSTALWRSPWVPHQGIPSYQHFPGGIDRRVARMHGLEGGHSTYPDMENAYRNAYMESLRLKRQAGGQNQVAANQDAQQGGFA